MGGHQVELKGGHRLRAESQGGPGSFVVHTACVFKDHGIELSESELLLGWPRGREANTKLLGDYSVGEEPG